LDKGSILLDATSGYRSLSHTARFYPILTQHRILEVLDTILLLCCQLNNTSQRYIKLLEWLKLALSSKSLEYKVYIRKLSFHLDSDCSIHLHKSFVLRNRSHSILL
jgi:hypothetical protein